VGAARVLLDAAQGRAGHRLVRRHPVDRALLQQALGVGGVAGQKQRAVPLAYDDRLVAVGVARRRDEEHVTGPRELVAPREGADRPVGEGDQAGREPRGQALREVAARLTADAGRRVVFRARHQDLRRGEVRQAAGVVGVQVREHEPAHLGGRQAEGAQPLPNLLLGPDPRAHAEAEVRVPPGEIARLGRARRFAGVDDDEALGVLDGPGVDGQRLGPGAVEQRVEATPRPMPDALALAALDRDRPGLDCVDLHQSSSYM